jgi:hypothetical protein
MYFIINDMPELLLPSSDSSHGDFLNVTAALGVPLNIHSVSFVDVDGHTELRVIVDTTDRAHIEDGSLHSDSAHEASVWENNIDGTRTRISSPDAGRYPFSERVERDRMRLPLAILFPEDMAILPGPNWDTNKLT